MRKLLQFLNIIQTSSNTNKTSRIKGVGGLRTEYHRLNPYNPLSYIFIILVLVVGIIMFGFVGFWKEIDFKNPFKWQ